MIRPTDAANSSRRDFVRGAGVVAGSAVLASTKSALGQAPAIAPSTPAIKAAPNPLTRYPKPPFSKQEKIEWPGLTSKMNPRPDHGENSYVGAGKLAGRKALITGGDSGIGRAVAIAFAREGADVAIGYLPFEEPDAQEVVELIRAAGRKAVALPGDIRDEGVCKKLVADAVAALGGLDILVNNAARQTAQPTLEDITTEQFDSTFKTNVYAMFWITKAALPHLKAGASIINTSSIQALDPSEDLVDYAQTKACNASFSKSMAKQLAPKGIRVNAVAPGPFWTPLQPSGGSTMEKVKSFGSTTPMGRPGQPAEIAPTFVLLAMGESSYITGEMFGNTGGVTPI